MDSLLDFGKMAQTAISLGNLEETARRNEIYEQNSLLEMGRLEVSREDLKLKKQKADQDSFTNLMKLADDPRVRANPQLEDVVLAQAWQTAGVPEVSPETFQRGRDQRRRVLDSLITGNKEEAGDALIELQVMANPQDAERIVKSVQDVQKISEYSENVEALRQVQRARFEKLHGQMAKINAGQLPFAQADQDLATALDGIDSPLFKKAVKTAETIRGKGETGKNLSALVSLGEDGLQKFSGDWVGKMAAAAAQRQEQYLMMSQQAQETLMLLEHGGTLPQGVARQDLQERVLVGKELTQAYGALAAWGHDPFNKATIKEAKTAAEIVAARRKQLEGLKASTAEEAIAIRKEAQTFRESEAGKKHAHEQAVAAAQTDVLGKFGYTPSAEQVSAVAKQHLGVSPQEILAGIGDPAKKGKLSLDINDPTTATRTQLQQQLVGVQGTVNIIDNLISTVEQGNIGFAAALKSTAYGFTSQIKGLAEATGAEASAAKHKNFTASKWFDPSLSTVDLLANTLAYRIINQEQGGRVSDKDFAEMKKRLNIDSWMAGKEDVVQRLKTMKNQLQFEEGVNRRILQTFGKAPAAGAISTAEDYLKSIGIGQ